jgi:hypothetical protein
METLAILRLVFVGVEPDELVGPFETSDEILEWTSRNGFKPDGDGWKRSIPGKIIIWCPTGGQFESPRYSEITATREDLTEEQFLKAEIQCDGYVTIVDVV